MGNAGDEKDAWTGAAEDCRGRGLVLAPFRGIRFKDAAPERLGALTSPPYDVIDTDVLSDLRQADPHNVVRLILPDSAHPEDAGRLFRAWRRERVLVADPEPVLYGYEQQGPAGGLQRGLLGAVGLRPERDGVILPHEDVMPGPVAGRMAVMRACAANLEPILLSYDGGGAASEIVRDVSSEPPLVTAWTPDGFEHRIWGIGGSERLTEIAEDLRPRQALIADGHHRYAASLGLQAEYAAVGVGPDAPGPWDFGLALLVDQREHPLQVAPIHRVVTGLGLSRLLDRLGSGPGRAFGVDHFGPERDAALNALAAYQGSARIPGSTAVQPPPAHALAVTDGREWVVVHAGWGEFHLRPSTDSGVLHEILLRQLLDVPEERISYVHERDHAIRSAGPDAAAVLLNPVPVETVHEYARQAIRMPRKSTSFGPKPRTGLVLRAVG